MICTTPGLLVLKKKSSQLNCVLNCRNKNKFVLQVGKPVVNFSWATWSTPQYFGQKVLYKIKP